MCPCENHVKAFVVGAFDSNSINIEFLNKIMVSPFSRKEHSKRQNFHKVLTNIYSLSKKENCYIDDVNIEYAQSIAKNFIICSPQIDRSHGWISTILSALFENGLMKIKSMLIVSV